MEAIAPANNAPMNGTRCPGCGRDLCPLPPQAAFCPGCRRRLRPRRTAWSAIWTATGWLLWGRPEPPVDRTGPRAPVVVGYSNALWRLGWRYEHGRGVMRNVPEAMRCYTKSAGLGNVEAAARIEAGQAGPVPVITIEPLDAMDE